MKRINFLVVFLSLAIAIFAVVDQLYLSNIDQIYVYYIKPIVWLSIALLFWFLVRKTKSVMQKSDKIVYVITFLILFTSLYYLLVIFFGYKYSAYNHSIFGMIRNIYSFVSILISYEMIRGSLISREKNSIDRACIYIAMSCIFLDIGRLVRIPEIGLSFSYILGDIAPILIAQYFLNYLVRHCGLTTTILWQLIPNIIIYITPIFPDLDWFYKFLYGLASPLITFVFLYYTYINKELVKDVKVGRKKKPFTGIITMVILFFMLGFFTGMFQIQPKVIISNSMNPVFYRGDMIIVKEKADYDIGSIIVYNHDNKKVVHRIVERVIDSRGIPCYITKGDNNKEVDGWYVYTDDIEAVYMFSIPKIGYLTILIQELWR